MWKQVISGILGILGILVLYIIIAFVAKIWPFNSIKCGGKCISNDDCSDLSNCSTCTHNVCSSSNPVIQCGDLCGGDNECANLPDCSLCIKNLCSKKPPPFHKKCGVPCDGDNQCDSLPVCKKCVYKQCAIPPADSCGEICINSKDCTGGCNTCYQETCSNAYFKLSKDVVEKRKIPPLGSGWEGNICPKGSFGSTCYSDTGPIKTMAICADNVTNVLGNIKFAENTTHMKCYPEGP